MVVNHIFYIFYIFLELFFKGKNLFVMKDVLVLRATPMGVAKNGVSNVILQS